MVLWGSLDKRVTTMELERMRYFMLRKGLVILGTVFLGLAGSALTSEAEVTEANAQTSVMMEQELVQTEEVAILTTEDIWKDTYCKIMYEDALSGKMIVARAMAEVKSRDLELMSSSTDHIVNYHGERFAITDDDYQMLLRIVEAEASGEGMKGKILVANVILNRLEEGFSGATSVSDVIFEKGQFQPVTTGRIFRVTVSEETVEAVERALDGEDYSRGTTFFKSTTGASKKGTAWFEKNLKLVFTYGGHGFYTTK